MLGGVVGAGYRCVRERGHVWGHPTHSHHMAHNPRCQQQQQAGRLGHFCATQVLAPGLPLSRGLCVARVQLPHLCSTEESPALELAALLPPAMQVPGLHRESRAGAPLHFWHNPMTCVAVDEKGSWLQHGAFLSAAQMWELHARHAEPP